MLIYLITNNLNGMCYVGQTIGFLKDRWSTHCSDSSGCTALSEAIRFFGKDSFTIESIFEAKSLEELCAKEKEFINIYNSLHPFGYNLNSGGTRPIFSEESKLKMSKSGKLRRPISEKTRKKLSKNFSGANNPNFGKNLSKEHREAISKANSGKRPWILGKKHSAATKRKILSPRRVPFLGIKGLTSRE